ncbi:MAG: glycosyltransferase [Planctomycetales bacterium]|nr:glycosyltransferase [Planctomycetales bacterium]
MRLFPTTSVIVSALQFPNLLRQVLIGFAHQTYRKFEIVVVQDGRSDQTRAVIESFAVNTDFPVRYVTEVRADDFKTQILNRAVQSAEGNYLIFTDGDCVPRDDFVMEHLRHATPGRFLSGGCCRLDRNLTKRILEGCVRYQEFTDPSWLNQAGGRVAKKWIWFQKRTALAKLMDLATTTRPTFNGHNASVWKADLRGVDGFRHEMRDGGFHRELGERLEDMGVLGMQIRHRAVCYHLDHDGVDINDSLWQRSRAVPNAA